MIEERIKLQNEIIPLTKQHSRLMLLWPTGVGKTKAALDIITYHGGKWLIVIAERNHIKTWNDEINKFYSGLVDADIICYQSLHKVKGKYTGIILDEGHHALSDLRLKLIENIKSNNLIILTATLTDVQLTKFQEIYGEFTIHRVSLGDAFNRKLLPEPYLAVIPIPLDTINLTERIGKTAVTPQEFYKHLDLLVEFKKNKFMDAVYTKSKYQIFLKNRWLRQALDRKHWIASQKTQATLKLLKALKNKQIICFLGSINQTMEIGIPAIHSKNPPKINKEILYNFETQQISQISAVGMLTEGVNLKGIEVGIITQLDGITRTFIQKFGRVLRNSYPLQILLFIPKTQDQIYLDKCLKEIDNKYVHIFNNLTDFINECKESK